MGSAADGLPSDFSEDFPDTDVLVRNSMQSLRISEQALVLQEAQLILAEKRTALSALRTGLAVMAAPLSVVSFLVATSQFYNVLDSLWLLAPLLSLCIVLVGIGSYLIMRAIVRIHQYDEKIRGLMARDGELRSLVVD